MMEPNTHALAPTEASGYPEVPGGALSQLPDLFSTSGVGALAHMSDQAFAARLSMLRRGQERLRTLHRELMVEGVDYGKIPGTDRPTIYKSGAEKLLLFYGLVPEFTDRIDYGDGVGTPPISVITECRLHVGHLQGLVVGSASGASTSWETKHRYRYAERVCPSCGTGGSIRRSKAEYGGGWYCDRRLGCGASFGANDVGITGQKARSVDNPDPWDLLNTLLKMAQKRAFVAATLIGTATSGLYTQDLEDQAQALAEETPNPTPPAASDAPAPQPARGARNPANPQGGVRSAENRSGRPVGADNRPAAPSGGASSPQTRTESAAPAAAAGTGCEVQGCPNELTPAQLTSSRQRMEGHRICVRCQFMAKRDGMTIANLLAATLSGPGTTGVPGEAPAAPTAAPVGICTDEQRALLLEWRDWATRIDLAFPPETVNLLAIRPEAPDLRMSEALGLIEEIRQVAVAAGMYAEPEPDAEPTRDDPATPALA